MKETVFRFLATVFAIGIIGTVGGIEADMLTWGRGILQIFICFGGVVTCHRIAEAIRLTERRKRKVVRK